MGDRSRKLRSWLITLTHVLPTLAFFGPHSKTITNHRVPPYSQIGSSIYQRQPPRYDHHRHQLNHPGWCVWCLWSSQIEHGEAKHYAAGRTFTNTKMVMIRSDGRGRPILTNGDQRGSEGMVMVLSGTGSLNQRGCCIRITT